MESGKIPLIPLTERNYPTWKIQIKMYLMRENLFRLVDGSETAPPSTDVDDYQKYCLRRDKALATIVLAIDPKLLYLIGDPTDPAVVWQKLQDTFQKKTWANKLRLKRRLYNMKLKPGDSLQLHLKNFIELFEELAVIGDAVDDEDRVINLLASLPDTYSTLVTALEALDKVPSWEAVTERLLHEEEKFKVNKPNDVGLNENSSLFVKQKFKRPVKCYNCGRNGHIKKYCNVKNVHENKDSSSKSMKGKVNLANKVNSSDEELTLYASALSTCMVNINNDSWVIDSGATQHMCNSKNIFSSFIEFSAPSNVEVGDGRSLSALGKGNISLKLNMPNDNIKSCILENVLYVPGLAYNLLSVPQIAKRDKKVIFYENECKIFDMKNTVLATGNKIGKLYILNCFQNIAVYCSNVSSSEILWHRRFCHLGMTNLRKLVTKELVRGIECDITKDSFLCNSCCDGKNHKVPFPVSESKSKHKVLDLIHSDVCGKLNPGSLGGGYYFVTFIDDASRYTWVYILKNKSDVFDTFKRWKTLVENLYEKKIKVFRTDNGGEYTSREFESYLVEEGIHHEKTIPKTPEQNGIAERMNRTLVEAVRCMLSDSKLPKTFWGEALSTAAYVRNRSPTVALQDMTPYEALNGHKPNVKHLRTFGCTSFVHIPKDERDKLDAKSKKCIFLGYGSTTKGYRLFNLDTKKVFHSRDVIFDEFQCTSFEKESSKPDEYEKYVEVEIPCEEEREVKDTVIPEINEGELRRSVRERKPPNFYGEWVNVCSSESSEPTSVEEALNSPDSNKWKEAMKLEMESIARNNVWTLVEPPRDRKPISCKWVFKKKIGSDGSVCSYKARLVAQGFTQKIGIDYEETFSPVVRFESVRTVLSLAAQHGLHVHHMDVSSAFLNGELSEELYMKQPDGFVMKGKENLVCKLSKSIYGLKQSAKCWNSALDSYLKELNFKQSSSDSCIYTLISDDDVCIIAVYVDDIIICCESLEYLSKMKSCLSTRFLMKDLGVLNYFLGVNIVQENNKIFINQSVYANNLLKKFGFENCKPVSTPVDISLESTLVKATDDSDIFDKEKYQSAVGSLLYLSTKTRPDINYAVCNVAKYCSNPTTRHWCAVKRIFRYIKGTCDMGILYDSHNSSECIGYSDADWAGDKSDRKSTSGYCFIMNNGLVSWRTNKQSCVALSTAEAEYVALAGAAQEAIWLKHLLSDMNFDIGSPLLIKEDNQSAICLAQNPKDHPKSKHIDIKYHFIRELVINNEIKIEYCPTNDMLADIFTKGLTADKFVKLRNMLGLCTVQKAQSM